MRPETRGFLLGLSLGVAALTGFGAAQIDRDMLGHYQIAASGSADGRWVYVIDTIRGQVWGKRADRDGFVSLGTPFDER